MHASRNMMTAASRGYHGPAQMSAHHATSYGCGGSSMHSSYSSYRTYAAPAAVTYGSFGTSYGVSYGSSGSQVAPVPAAAVPEAPVPE